jgi:predicted ATPase
VRRSVPVTTISTCRQPHPEQTSRPRQSKGRPPDAVYEHALLQDVAHSSLLRSARRQLHAQIAEALEAHSPRLMDSQPELFAQHYTQAGLA